MCCFFHSLPILALLALPCGGSAWVSSPCGLPDAVPSSNRINITVGNLSGPIGILVADWDSGRLMAELTKILLEEQLGYNSIFSGRTGSSLTSVQMLGNCRNPGSTDPGCDNPPPTSVHHITLEVWNLCARDIADVKTVQEAMAPQDHGSLGYDGIEGMYVSEAQVNEVYESNGVALSYYRNWNTSWNNFSSFFANYRDIDVSDLRTCNDTPMAASLIWADYVRYTQDGGGIETVNGVSIGKCEGGLSGHWWLSPACRSQPTECIPLITRGIGYGMPTLTQQAAAYDMPVAISTARTEPGPQSSRSPWHHQILFYSWQPDAAFVNLNPQLVVFPKTDRKARIAGDFRTQIASVSLLKFTHFTLGTVAARANDLIANMDMPEEGIEDILKRQAAGATITDAACQWLKSRRAIWTPWIVDATSCKSGNGIANETGHFVTDKAQAVSCKPCDPGRASNRTADGSTYVCVKCLPGKTSKHMAESCNNCTAGRFAPKAGLGFCFSAPPGSHVPLSGAARSEPCSSGSFSVRIGSSTCSMCNLGEFVGDIGSTACTRCPSGKFAMSSGHSECVACSTPNTSTPGMGARSEVECICHYGLYRLGVNATGACRVCPSQMSCEQGSTERSLMHFLLHGEPAPSLIGDVAEPYPSLIKGFWSARSDPFSIYKCWNDDKCPGGPPGQCAPNMDLTKRSCSHCRTDYFWDGEKCEICTEAQKTIFIFPTVVLLGAILVVVFMYEVFKDHMQAWNSWKNHISIIGFLAFNHYQVITLFSKANVDLPSTLRGTVKSWSFTVNINLMFNLSCAGYGEFKDFLLVQSLSPIFFFGCTALVACAYWIAFNVLKIQRMALDLDRMHNVFFSVLFTYFIGIASMSMALFNCKENPNGELSLANDLNIICYESDWNDLLVIAIFAVLLYCIGMGALFAWVLLKIELNPSSLRDLGFQMRWKFLLIKFNPDHHWWPLVFLLRGVLLNLSFAIFSVGIRQMYFFFTVEMIYLLLTVWYMPWRFRAASGCSLLIHASIIYLATMPLLYADFDDEASRELADFGTAVSFLPLVVAAVVVIRLILVEWAILTRPQIPSLVIEELEQFLLCYLESDRKDGYLVACLGDWDNWYLRQAHQSVKSNFLLTHVTVASQLRRQTSMTLTRKSSQIQPSVDVADSTGEEQVEKVPEEQGTCNVTSAWMSDGEQDDGDGLRGTLVEVEEEQEEKGEEKEKDTKVREASPVAPVAAEIFHQVERRVADDGKSYTKPEFQVHFPDSWQQLWDVAPPAIEEPLRMAAFTP